MTAATNEYSGSYKKLGSGGAKSSSGGVKPSSGDANLTFRDDVLITPYARRLSKKKQGQLAAIAKTVTGNRNVARSMRDEIFVAMRSIAPFSTYEISSLIKANSAYTRIAPKQLVETGRLRYLHPDRVDRVVSGKLCKSGVAE